MTGYWVLIDRSAYLGYSAVPVSIVYLCTWTAIKQSTFSLLITSFIFDSASSLLFQITHRDGYEVIVL